MSNAAAARRIEEPVVLKIHPAMKESSAPAPNAKTDNSTSRLDQAVDLAIAMVKRHRSMAVEYDQTFLNELVRNECIRLLQSEDNEELWRGMRFYLKVFALQVKMEGQELDLMMKAIEDIALPRTVNLRRSSKIHAGLSVTK